jgi:hypothetical protein
MFHVKHCKKQKCAFVKKRLYTNIYTNKKQKCFLTNKDKKQINKRKTKMFFPIKNRQK